MPELSHFLKNNIIDIELVEKYLLATIAIAITILIFKYIIILKY